MMKSIEQIHRVKVLQMQQQGPCQIAKKLKMDVKTVCKYMAKKISPAVAGCRDKTLQVGSVQTYH